MKSVTGQILISVSLPFILLAAMYVNDINASKRLDRGPAVEKSHKHLLTATK